MFADWTVLEERDSLGTVTAQYVSGPGIDNVLARIGPANTVYYQQDGLASTVTLTNTSGAIVESYTYDAFGVVGVLGPSGVLQPSPPQSNRFLFTGCELLREAGVYDYLNRVYSPTLGRFLQTDPIRFSAGDGNRYRYVGNNPASWGDPFGLAYGLGNGNGWVPAGSGSGHQASISGVFGASAMTVEGVGDDSYPGIAATTRNERSLWSYWRNILLY